MSNYSFTDLAEKDLESIIDYTVESWGREQANKYISGLEELAQTLAENPDLGFNRGHLSEGFGIYLFKSYPLLKEAS